MPPVLRRLSGVVAFGALGFKTECNRGRNGEAGKGEGEARVGTGKQTTPARTANDNNER